MMHDNPGTFATVGSRLRSERERIGMSQADFAAVAGVKRNTQGEYEKDGSSPSAAYLLALAERGVDPVFVLTGKRGRERLDEELSAILDLIAVFGADDRRAIRQILQTMARATPATTARLHAPGREFRGESD